MFLARKSRVIGSFSGSENRRWLGRALATTMVKSQKLSEGCILWQCWHAGYQGVVRAFTGFFVCNAGILPGWLFNNRNSNLILGEPFMNAAI